MVTFRLIWNPKEELPLYTPSARTRMASASSRAICSVSCPGCTKDVPGARGGGEGDGGSGDGGDGAGGSGGNEGDGGGWKGRIPQSVQSS
eukprot:567156-Prymnesium_polylepis.1